MTAFTKIETSKFLAICEKLGLNVEKQPSQYKVTGEDRNKRFYIPGTSKVHKVELSGWAHELAAEWSAAYPGKKAPSGKITHVVNFAQEEKLVLKDFFKMAKSLAKGVQAEPKTEVPAVAETAPEAPATEPVAEVAEAPAQELAVG